MVKTTRLTGIGLLLLIGMLAAYLRFGGLAYSPIGSQQSILLRIAANFANTGKLPLAAAKSAAGMINPPLIEYLIALPLFFQRSLLTAVRFQALLSLAAVFALYLFSKPLFGRRPALLATLLFATSPWAIYYGRFLHTASPIPLFSTLLLGSLLRSFGNGRRPHYLALSFLWLAAITQLHLGALVLIPTFLFILLLFWRKPPQEEWPTALKPFAAGLALFLLLYLPYFLFDRAAGFGNLRAILDAPFSLIVAGGETAAGLAPFSLALELASGSHLFAPDTPWGAAVWPWFALIPIVQVFFAAAFVYALLLPLYGRFRPQHKGQAMPFRHQALLILALWILIPVLLSLPTAAAASHDAFLYLLPAPFLLIALVVDEILAFSSGRMVSRAARWAVTAVILAPLLALALWQAHAYHTRLTLLASGELATGRQVVDIERIIARNRAHLQAYPGCDLVMLGKGDHADTAPLGLVEDFVYPAQVRFVAAGRGLILPQQCTLYFVTATDPLAESWLAANGQALPSQAADGRSYYVAGRETAAVPLAIWRNGLELLDFNLEGTPAPGQQLTLQYTWHVIQKPLPDSHYHFFNHFLDESGNIVAQEDGPGVQTLYWQRGDRFMTQFYLNLPADLPPGDYTIQTGVYTWPDLRRIRLRRSQATTFWVTAVEVAAP